MPHPSAAPLLLLTAMTALAAPSPSAPRSPPPSDAECKALPALRAPFSFSAGETLEFDLDALGAQAGTLSMRVLAVKDGTLPIEVRAQTNTFFSKVRRVKGVGTSYLNPKSLRPTRYVEDAVENEVHKSADVAFRSRDHHVRVQYTLGSHAGQSQFRYANDGLDVAGAIYLMRQLPLRDGLTLCFDAYGIRTLWRVSGKVEGREHVSLPLGEFEAWHISGVAIRLDNHSHRRELHVWISDDERRLPLAALGAIDLGTVRATLTAFSRPGDAKARAQGKDKLKW